MNLHIKLSDEVTLTLFIYCRNKRNTRQLPC